MAQFHALKIAKISRETPQAVTITFKVPDELNSKFKFKAGQYVTLKTSLEGEEIRRDYSICTAPGSGHLSVAVKAVSQGLFSKYANEALNEGDVLEVSEPNGRFIFEPNDEAKRTFVAFTAGSGITPVLSIVRTILGEEPQSAIHVLYGNKSKSETMFYDELLALKNRYPERLRLQFIYSQANEADALFGRIDTGNAKYFLKNLNAKDVAAYYLCGPEEMIYAMSDMLKNMGVEKDHIKFELFTVKVEEPKSVEVSPGKTKVTIMLDDEESNFIMDGEQSVLDAALKENLDPPYSCQGGICSTCLARLKEGEVVMRKNSILTDEEIEEGLILTCQSHPQTRTLYIDYDDI